ncbi:MAG: hypothetical protein OEY52_16010 [Gammaproteobacteria bacterium]|nr:hypothetical protein [Gammaproteobacteria bacterium]
MLKEISFGGIADSIIAWAIIGIVGLFIKNLYARYNNNKKRVEKLEEDIEKYISSEQKVTIRRDFTRMVTFYISGIKHQQTVGYFYLLIYFVLLLFQLILQIYQETTIYRIIYLSLLVAGFVYFAYLRHQTDNLLYRVEKKCIECYGNLIPELNNDDKA